MDAPVGGERFLFENFRLDPGPGRLFHRDATGDWEPVPIGLRALDVLKVLLKSPGVVVSKDAIMDAVWPGVAVEPANLTVQIATLRRVLDEGRSGESCIQTVQGRGYRLDLGVTQVAKAPFGASPEPVAEPADVPEVRAPGCGPRRWRIATTGAVAIIALLLVAAWASGWLPGTRAPHPLSLVVLPFANLSGDPRDDYLADGITGDLTTALAHIPGAFVIARATAYTYRGKAEDIRRIGRDLDVRYMVRGTMQRFGQVLRVNAELGSTESGAQLWSDNFDQPIRDLAAGQEEIVIRMRTALNIRLADIEAARSLREHPTNPDAFDLILRARAIEWLPQTKDTQSEILSLYDQALERDPNAVLALTGAANAVLGVCFYDDDVPCFAGKDRAEHYLSRALALEPNSESVLDAQAQVLEFLRGGLDQRRVTLQEMAAARKLTELYPNNAGGYFYLAVIARDDGKYDEALEYFAKTIRLNPRSPSIKNRYWHMAHFNVRAGHDQEGLEWANRTMGVQGDLPAHRVMLLLSARAVAYYRTGDVDTAKRLVAELNERYPFVTWRRFFPYDPDSQTDREQIRSYQNALKAAGHRDHLDPDADFGVPATDALHAYNIVLGEKTPTTAPGVTTVSSEQLASMLEHGKPLVIDTMDATWYRSVPGAVGLDFNDNTAGTFDDATQQRLEKKLHELTGGDMAKPIVAIGFNVARFDGYNLALRIRHAGYANVYWYRGGREAWEVAGKSEDVVRPADW